MNCRQLLRKDTWDNSATWRTGGPGSSTLRWLTVTEHPRASASFLRGAESAEVQRERSSLTITSVRCWAGIKLPSTSYSYESLAFVNVLPGSVHWHQYIDRTTSSNLRSEVSRTTFADRQPGKTATFFPTERSRQRGSHRPLSDGRWMSPLIGKNRIAIKWALFLMVFCA